MPRCLAATPTSIVRRKLVAASPRKVNFSHLFAELLAAIDISYCVVFVFVNLFFDANISSMLLNSNSMVVSLRRFWFGDSFYSSILLFRPHLSSTMKINRVILLTYVGSYCLWYRDDMFMRINMIFSCIPLLMRTFSQLLWIIARIIKN